MSDTKKDTLRASTKVLRDAVNRLEEVNSVGSGPSQTTQNVIDAMHAHYRALVEYIKDMEGKAEAEAYVCTPTFRKDVYNAVRDILLAADDITIYPLMENGKERLVISSKNTAS